MCWRLTQYMPRRSLLIYRKTETNLHSGAQEECICAHRWLGIAIYFQLNSDIRFFTSPASSFVVANQDGAEHGKIKNGRIMRLWFHCYKCDIPTIGMWRAESLRWEHTSFAWHRRMFLFIIMTYCCYGNECRAGLQDVWLENRSMKIVAEENGKWFYLFRISIASISKLFERTGIRVPTATSYRMRCKYNISSSVCVKCSTPSAHSALLFAWVSIELI